MSHPHEEQSDFVLTFEDLLTIVKKNKKKFFGSAIFFAVLALCYGLTKPIEYEAEATFKEKNKSQSGFNNSLSAAFFMLSDVGDSNALAMMRSRVLLEDLVKDQGLQGQIVKVDYRFPLIPFETIKNNILTEYALLMRLPIPILKDPEVDFKFDEIAYTDEVPIPLEMRVLSDKTFAIYDHHKRKVGEGEFGRPFSKDHYSFTLSQTRAIPVDHGVYNLVLLPLELTAQRLSKLFTIESDRSDKGLLKISYRNRDRKQAASHVNALMALYQKHIECEHENLCEKQVGYLIQRQREMGKILEGMMQTYADVLASDLSSTGFATSEKAMEFLASTQQKLKEKLFATTLEIQRLDKVQQEGEEDHMISALSHSDLINRIAVEKRQLKQQADSLNLALRSDPNQTHEFQQSFLAQLEELDQIKQALQESQRALVSLENNEIPVKSPKLNDESKYIFNAWHERLTKLADNGHVSEECAANWKECRSGFAAYLSHLNHYLSVYQRNIEEKLAHQQAPLKEFQGINLNIARELYISYNRDLSALESRTSQHEYILTQLDEPTFEISSLSTILTDSLGQEMISRVSNLILALKDQDNRSSKEQERLNAELAIQKGFLRTHIEQSMALLQLHQNFLKEKIQSLQSITLSLIQEELSILDNQLKEYISSALDSLYKEKELISDNLAELRIEMASFPQKWAAEQMIYQQMEINKGLVEEVSKLVESKNIANNLEKLQSAPVDRAFSPIHPKSPHLILLTLAGAVLGMLVSFIWTLGRSIVDGVQVSEHTLVANGQDFSGLISSHNMSQGDFYKHPLLDPDLSTLRRITTFMEAHAISGNHMCLLLEGKGANYSDALAELLARKGLKVLVVELRFDEVSSLVSSGMLPYLEGKVDEPKISSTNGYDKIGSGGICRYANELISSRRFRQLLDTLSRRYDWVLLSSSASSTSAEADTLLDIFPLAIVTLVDETIQDLRPLSQRVRENKNQITYVGCFV